MVGGKFKTIKKGKPLKNVLNAHVVDTDCCPFKTPKRYLFATEEGMEGGEHGLFDEYNARKYCS